MSRADGRSVGEVLLDAEQVARDLLHEAPSLDGRAMVRTWGEVVDTAAELWDALPLVPPTPVRGRERTVDIMDQLQQGATSLHRRDRLATPSTTYDERLLTVSEAFTRATHLVSKHPPSSGWQNRAQRDDVNAVRARVVHTLYVTAHGVTVALAANLAEHQQLRPGQGVTAQGYPVAMLADAYRRMSALEQLTGSYVAHTYPQVLTGQHRDPVHDGRLAEAFSSWDVQAHRALAAAPEGHTLRVVAAEQAWMVGASNMLWRAVTDTGHADLDQYRARLAPVVDRVWEQWGQAAETWRGLAPRQVHPPPAALTTAGRELRAAVRELLHDPGGPATPQAVAARVDPRGVVLALQQVLATSVDLAHAFRDATAHPDLLVSARGVNTALGARVEPAPGHDRTEAVVDAHTLHVNRSIPLPDALRARVQVAGDGLVTASHQALGSSAGITGHHVTPQARTPVPTTPVRPDPSVEDMVVHADRHLHSTRPRR